MRAIDLRLRPPFGSFLDSGIFFKNPKAIEATMKKRELKEVPESVRQASMDLMIQEMDEAGVTYGAVPMRVTDNGNNDDLLALEKQYPGRFLGLPQINPLNQEKALTDIDKYVVHGPCKGIYIEHASIFNTEHWNVNDERAFPVYERCQDLDIPILFTYGGQLVKSFKYFDPVYIEEVATIFPKLNMIMGHGGWPYVLEICHVATQHSNIFIEPDLYMMNFTGGWQDYVTEANHRLQDQFIFGTAYPGCSFREAVEKFKKVIRSEVQDKFFYANAARLFHLEM